MICGVGVRVLRYDMAQVGGAVLVALTKPLDVAVGDQADGESEEGFVDVVASFPADPQAAEAVQLLKALANEPRLLVLCHLAEVHELSVGVLAERVGLSQSALSQHLAKLRDHGLVTTRKQAQTVFYSVADPKALQLLSLLHDLFCPQLGRDVATEPNRS